MDALASQGEVQPECLVELGEQLVIEYGDACPDALDVDRADLFRLCLTLPVVATGYDPVEPADAGPARSTDSDVDLGGA